MKDQEVRRGLLERIASAMATMYRDRVHGSTLAARMESLRALFGERRVPLDVAPAGTRQRRAARRLAAVDRGGMPLPGTGRKGPGHLRGGKDVICQAARAAGSAVAMPLGWP